MKNRFAQPEADAFNSQPSNKPSAKFWAGAAAVTAIVAGAIVFGPRFTSRSAVQAAGPPAAVVTVSMPLKKDLSVRLQFLGQYSAVERVELRAQVGGTLTHIGFKDGDIVHQGDFLFEIDPTPYQIKLSQATAQLEKARTQVEKATGNIRLRRSGYGGQVLLRSRLPPSSNFGETRRRDKFGRASTSGWGCGDGRPVT